MLHHAVIFFVIALIAALLGFTGIAASAAGIAKIVTFLFLIIAATTLEVALARRTGIHRRNLSHEYQRNSG